LPKTLKNVQKCLKNAIYEETAEYPAPWRGDECVLIDLLEDGGQVSKDGGQVSTFNI